VCKPVEKVKVLVPVHHLYRINFLGRRQGEDGTLSGVDEGRKRVLLIAAAILAARKLANWDGRPSPAFECAIADAIVLAERILSKIDARWT
jgi:hypothetical protein